MSKLDTGRRSDQEIMIDLELISELYLKGHSQGEIVRIFAQTRPYSLSEPTIRSDLEKVMQMWQNRIATNVGQAKAAELARIDLLEKEAWAGWRRSMAEKETTVSENVNSIEGSRTKAQIKREGRDGSTEFLKVVQWCIDKRCDILGIYAATSSGVNWKDEIILALRNGLTTPRHVMLAYPDSAEEIILKSGLLLPAESVVEGEYEEHQSGAASGSD